MTILVVQGSRPSGRDFYLGSKRWLNEEPEESGMPYQGNEGTGAWAELYFMVLAMSQGLKVSSPYGGLGPYDVGVEDGTGPILRVQVKCTLYQCREGCYCMSVNVKDGSKGRRGYARGTVDFFAIYIIPTDDWYVIPYAVVGERDANLYFRPGFKGQKYGEYKENCDLSRLARAGPTPIRRTLH
jgi:hypothetical protein